MADRMCNVDQICTSIEQSKKLLSLGLDPSTADMWYSYYGDSKYNPTIAYKGQQWFLCQIRNSLHNDIPAWSLSVLLGLMPFHIIENNNRFGFYQVKGFNKQGETYRFGYKTNDNSFLFETSWHNNVIDAAFEMICWLKKEKYI
jgi:hypothetical protein